MFGDFFKQKNATPLTVVYPSYVEYIDDNGLRDMWMVSQFEAAGHIEVLFNDSLYDVLNDNGRSSMSFVSESDQFTVGISDILEINIPENDNDPIEVSLKARPFNASIGSPVSMGFREGKEVIYDRISKRIFWNDIEKPILTLSSIQDSLLNKYYRVIGFDNRQISETFEIISHLPFSVLSAGTFILEESTIYGMLRIRMPEYDEYDSNTIIYKSKYCLLEWPLGAPWQAINLFPISSKSIDGYSLQYYYTFDKADDHFLFRVRPDSLSLENYYIASYSLDSNGNNIHFDEMLKGYLYPNTLLEAGYDYQLSDAYLMNMDSNLLVLFRNDGHIYDRNGKKPLSYNLKYNSGDIEDREVYIVNEGISFNRNRDVLILRGNVTRNSFEVLKMSGSGDIERIAEYPSAKYVYGKVLPTFAVLTKIEKPKMKRTIYYWE